MSERLSDDQLDQFERRIDQEFTGEAHLTSDEMRTILAELRGNRDTDKADGMVALLRIREHAAKKDNEQLKTLLAAALDVADMFLLNADKGASTTNLDAMDKLHTIRTEARRLGVE
jgi:hypothetical protein